MARDGPIPDAQPAQTLLHHFAIDGVTVSHQISWRLLPGERLDELPSNPLRRRIKCYRMVDEPSAGRAPG
jgi:hypothetical protein